MAAVKNSVSASKDALAAIFGKDSAKAQVGSKAEQEEPPSGIEGKGTVDEPYDQGNAPEQAPVSDPSSSPADANQGSGVPLRQPNATETEEVKDSKSHLESVMGKKQEPASKPEEPTPTPAAAPAPVEKKAEEPTPETGDRGRKKEWPTTRAGQQERSVSPGTMPDGTHATTHGDKGEGYQPKGKLGRMAGKVFGAH